MPVLAQCPFCRRKQSIKNKKCKCGVYLDKLKKQNKVRYWIDYRLPDGKKRREAVGSFKDLDAYSFADAKVALSKRSVQRSEKRMLDMLPESTTTFQQLTDWYLSLTKVKKLKSYIRIKQALHNFNIVFGNKIADNIKAEMLEEYQEDRVRQGRANATIDMEINYAKAVIIKAFYNDKVEADALKAFKSIEKMLGKGENARKRPMTFDEYVRLIDKAPQHLQAFIIVAFNTGMRVGELRLLKWKYVDKLNGIIRLPKNITKEKRPKNIPINHHVMKVLDSLPRAIMHDYVFTYEGQPITSPAGLKRSFKTACKNAKIPYGTKAENGLIFHDIRGTVKTNMLNAGVDKVFRDLILGHSLRGMDAHYMTPDDAALTEAMNKYTMWLDGQWKNFDPSFDPGDKNDKASTS